MSVGLSGEHQTALDSVLGKTTVSDRLVFVCLVLCLTGVWISPVLHLSGKLISTSFVLLAAGFFAAVGRAIVESLRD